MALRYLALASVPAWGLWVPSWMILAGVLGGVVLLGGLGLLIG